MTAPPRAKIAIDQDSDQFSRAEVLSIIEANLGMRDGQWRRYIKHFTIENAPERQAYIPVAGERMPVDHDGKPYNTLYPSGDEPKLEEQLR